jgi:hypothetical protein
VHKELAGAGGHRCWGQVGALVVGSETQGQVGRGRVDGVRDSGAKLGVGRLGRCVLAGGMSFPAGAQFALDLLSQRQWQSLQ